MKLYLISFNGIWLGGYAFVTAGYPKQAKQRCLKMLKDQRPHLAAKNTIGDLTIQVAIALDPGVARAGILDDGDY